MPSVSPHGRRRKPTSGLVPRTALPMMSPTTGRHRPLPGAGARARRRKQVTAAATLSVAALLTAALTAAHAGTAPTGTAPAVQASETVAAAAPVQAPVGASISYERPAVTTEQAPLPVPAKTPLAAAGAATTPAASPVPAAAAPAQPVSAARLGAPLAGMSVTSPFGIRTSPISGTGELHTGLDLVAACQTAVFAAGAGTVVEAGWSPYGGGNRIVVDHGNGLKSTYNHLASIETSVGATVSAGQRLAAAGTTGNSTGCHLHFEVLLNGQTVNPQGWM